MNTLKNILSFLNKTPQEKIGKTPEGFCPNCWGRQEYGGNFFKALKAEKLENLERKKGWITAYVERNLKHIQLQHKEKKQVCNVCFESFDC
ncbi:hypothetical protein [Gaetbulibacter jejuensis]|uniref:Uncharacterized protein n=1 Tax=Gaetbulibacter jejuensis TaxID=584607 RepID=A0ABN1JP04_9FLAO